jgi:hypothetical protein
VRPDSNRSDDNHDNPTTTSAGHFDNLRLACVSAQNTLTMPSEQGHRREYALLRLGRRSRRWTDLEATRVDIRGRNALLKRDANIE